MLPRIAIEGNIGVGKTTLLNNLQMCTPSESPYHFYTEPVGEWAFFLERFYKDRSRWACPLQLQVLKSFVEREKATSTVARIDERSPLASVHVFIELQRLDGILSPEEAKLFADFFELTLPKPTAIVYLESSPDQCYTRMQNRGRSAEREVPLDYLCKVHSRYEDLVRGVEGTIPVLRMRLPHHETKAYEYALQVIWEFAMRFV